MRYNPLAFIIKGLKHGAGYLFQLCKGANAFVRPPLTAGQAWHGWVAIVVAAQSRHVSTAQLQIRNEIPKMLSNMLQPFVQVVGLSNR